VSQNGGKKLAHGTNAMPRHVMLAIKNDPLLASLFSSVHIGACGVQVPGKELSALAMVIKRNRANNESKRRKGKRQRTRARVPKTTTTTTPVVVAVESSPVVSSDAAASSPSQEVDAK
jgi:hypothetical protein